MELTFTAESFDGIVSQVRAFLDSQDTTSKPVADTKAVKNHPAHSNPKAKEPEPDEPEVAGLELDEPEPEVKKTTRKAPAKRAKKQAKPDTEDTDSIEQSDDAEIDYEKDVRPLLAKTCNTTKDGRKFVLELLRKFDVDNMKNLPVEKLPEVVKLLEEKLNEA